MPQQCRPGGGGRIPIIALTAHAINEERDHCLAAGMDAILCKPIQANGVLKRVAERCHDGSSSLRAD